MAGVFNCGKIGMVYRENWVANPSRPYTHLDVVTHNNAIWIARKEMIDGEEPGQRDSWVASVKVPLPSGGEAGHTVIVDENGEFAFANAEYMQTLTVSGAWTAPYSGLYQVEVQGGGGSGGGVTYLYNLAAMGGGGSGEYKSANKFYSKGDNVIYTIGAGGVGDTTQSKRGGATTFDGINAAGGVGGVCYSHTSNVGSYVYFPGSGLPGGQNGFGGTIDGLYGGEVGGVSGGKGACSMFGVGGHSANQANASNGSVNGANAYGYGAGGEGAAVNKAAAKGGNGSQGCIRITLLMGV